VVWGVRSSHRDLSRYDWVVRAVYRAARALAPRAELIICNSRDGAALHAELGYPRSRMTVVPNGIDTERFVPDPLARDRVRAEWGIAPDAPVVGIVGRTVPVKDYETFLRAASLLARRIPEVRFAVAGEAGEPQYAASMRAIAKALGIADCVLWTGPRRDVHAVYNALDVLALSSLREGFPNVVGEAMACGVPCVVTDAGDAAWIVGDTGAVVDVGDAPAFAAALERLLASRRDPAVRAWCRARIVREFGLQALVRGTERALERLEPGA
jgi:glycosyltransferase involved in cell wall biosynthesis